MDVEETPVLIPFKNPRALAAYYVGVFGLIPGVGLILGPLALVLGILGKCYANAHPKAKGGAHALTGIILGALTSLGNWGTLITIVVLLAMAPAKNRDSDQRVDINRPASGIPGGRPVEPGLAPQAAPAPGRPQDQGINPKAAPGPVADPDDDLNEPLFSKNRDLLNSGKLNVPPENGLVAAVRVGGQQVIRLLIAPDGKTLAVVTSSGSRVVEFANSRVHELPGFVPLAYSPDSRALAAAIVQADRSGLALLNPIKRNQEAAIGDLGPNGSCHGVQFSPDGRYFAAVVAVENASRLLVWKCRAWREGPKRLLASREFAFFSPAFAPDGATLAIGTGHPEEGVGVQLLDPENGETKAWLFGHSKDHSLYSIAYSPDGKSLASASGDKTIIIWDTGTNKERWRLRGHQQAVSSVVFSPDGALVASRSPDGSFRLWDAKTGQQLAVRDKEETSTPDVLEFTSDGKLLVTGSKGLLKAWDVAKLVGR